MEEPRSVTRGLRALAAGCLTMGSPFYGRLIAFAAEAYVRGGAVQRLLDLGVNPDRVGLLLASAAHYRALSGEAPQIAAHFPSTGGDGDAHAAWRAIESDIEANDAAYRPSLATTVQTNEVARALPLLAGMLNVASATKKPLRIFEVGSSAGFLQNVDRYRYEGNSWVWGDPGSELVLRESGTGAPKYLDAPLHIDERRGCDLRPLDVRRSEDANRLLSFIWADQTERFDRIRRAIVVARAHPPAIDRADGIDWIKQHARPRAGSVTVVFHSVVTEHLLPAQRDVLRDTLAELAQNAAGDAPFAWLRMEPPSFDTHYETRVTLWPPNSETLVARSDGHAKRLEWNMADT